MKPEHPDTPKGPPIKPLDDDSGGVGNGPPPEPGHGKP